MAVAMKPSPSPLIFVVQLRCGREYPAIYHGELPPVYDPIVWRHEIPRIAPLDQLMREFVQHRELGALPSET